MSIAKKRRQKKQVDNAAKASQPAHVASHVLAEQQQTLTIQQAIDLGVQHHNAGDLPKAESVYQQILQVEPNQPVALHLLGVIAHQVGKNDIAADLIGKALAIKPDFVEAHSNLGRVFQVLGKLGDAVASYRKALVIKSDFAEAYNNLGLAFVEQGKLNDAVASYRKALTINPDHVQVHYNLGLAFMEQGKLGDAVASYRKALSIQPDFAEAYNNLGNVLKEQGKLDDAVASYRKAQAINPDYADAHSNLGTTLKEQGKLDDALASYCKALAINPDFAAAHYNLGNLLKEQGKLDDAVASYRKALAIKPDYADAHSNLGTALKEQGKLDEALIHHRRAIKLNPEKNPYWAGLAKSIRSLSFTSVDDYLLRDLLNLLERATVRPAEIIRPIISALGHHQEFSQIAKLVSTVGSNSNIDHQSTAAQLSAIPLFLRIMALVPIPDLNIERMLTFLRCSMLQETIEDNIKDDGLPFAAALALHCFTNEYVYAETDEETQSVEHIQEQISELVERERDVPSSLIAALGAYRPLHKFPWAQKLTEREWSDYINAVIERQITEPFTELSLRLQFPCLTPVQDTVSKSVREQYEENPYPRWVKTSLADERKSIGIVLKSAPLHFDLGGYQTPYNPEILIAGCGTGQHSLGTTSRFKDAQILAVDLSLSSLSYAARKTYELGISNIEYAQADIMELGILERQFDLIESAGVLHHLDDPLAGWKVLVDLLKPGGLMKIGLYSDTARQHIVAGRSMISEMGYTASPEDIRQCRQNFIALAEDGNAAMDKICKTRDFYSLSTCRDLLFHVQEHRFTIPSIIDALDALSLKFLGFEMQDQSAMTRFKEIYPKANSLTSLALWHEFEQRHPDTFIGMYQFWCQKQ